MNPETPILNFLPEDIAFKILSYLQVSDVCSLGSCSRFWRRLCGSDSVWEALCKRRWPGLVLQHDSSANFKGWRVLYMKKHAEMAREATNIVDFVKQCSSRESIESDNYLKAIEAMNLMQFRFQDVQMFFLKRKLNVFVNIVGLLYCIMYLEVPVECMTEALGSYWILKRRVCVKWWKRVRLFNSFRLRVEENSRNISLEDLATAKETEVLAVMQQGVVHDVVRVQISDP